MDSRNQRRLVIILAGAALLASAAWFAIGRPSSESGAAGAVVTGAEGDGLDRAPGVAATSVADAGAVGTSPKADAGSGAPRAGGDAGSREGERLGPDQLAEVARALALSTRASTSIGGPSDGRLEGGVPLPLRGPGFRFDPSKRVEARYGTVELVQALIHAAGAFAERFPDSELMVNDLAVAQGGPISRHGSHQNGRDVDILFFLRDADGAPYPPMAIPLDPEGQGWDFRDLAAAEDDVWVALDAERTWAFLEALLARDGERVQRIFIAEHLRNALLVAAEDSDAPAALSERFEAVTCQPKGAPHDDHMHLRLFCSTEDLSEGCQDVRPIYPWRVAELASQGLEPVLYRPQPGRRTVSGAPTSKKRTSKKRTVSRAEARAQAGKLHPDVERFLDRREQWATPPKTGRRWCP